MREIKFRAWDNDGYMFHQEETEGGMYFVMNKDPEFSYPLHHIMCDREWTLMQYTGLKDKNGVEIYEGDILKYSGSKCPYCEHEEFYEGHEP